MMKKNTLGRLWNYAGKYKLHLIGVFLCAFLGNTLSLIGPLLTGRGIDYIIAEGKVDFSGLLNIAAILLGLYLLGSAFQWLMAMISNVVANKTIQDLRGEAFEKLNTLPLNYFDSKPHGDIISRLTNDIDAISEGLFQGITQVISGIVIIAGTFLFMLTISPAITLIVVLITPVCFLIASFIAKMSNKMFREQSKILGELNGYVEEILGSQKVVKAFGYEKRAEKKFREINGRLYIWGQKSQWYSSLTNPTTRYVNNAAYVAVTVMGGFLAIAGSLSVGNIAAFLTYSNQFAKPINEITSIAAQIQAAAASAARVFALLDEESETEVFVVEEKSESTGGAVEFSHVNFSYRKDLPLIKNLNLKAEEGDMVAIVGPTGAGKTTLVNLLMRFYDVDEGEIRLGGTDIKKISREKLRSTIGMVLQDSWLFRGTVADNIRYGSSEASLQEVTAAAKSAHAHSFIMRLSQGYDTVIDEDGRNLSAGQKQLLTIARVLLIDPPMLILDEATSSIDTRTESLIQKAFHKMMKGRTSFVIAHRLSTIREADNILVMNYGRIVEQGSHEELIARQGFYFKLYNSQFANQ